jgi:uncharacterized tellurite resistance protein B-like protein
MPSELDLLRLAFKKGLLDDIARADRDFTPEEQLLVDRLAPPADLRAAGFLDDQGHLTAWFHTRRTEARERLSRELRALHRLDLITEFLELCLVDGELHLSEGSLLLRAAHELGIDGHTLNAHLDTLHEHVGQVDVGDPE